MVPNANNFSRWPMIWLCRRPPTICPSIRWTASGNSVCMKRANAPASRTKNRDGVVTRTDAWYTCSSPGMYADHAPQYTPRWEVRLVSMSTPAERLDITSAPSSST